MTAKHRTPEWLKYIKRERPRVKAALPLPCIQTECYRGGIVMPDDRFDMAHREGYENYPPSAQTVGPAHSYCNRKAGQAMSVKTRTEARQRDERLPGW